jgi:hypothetical protein
MRELEVRDEEDREICVARERGEMEPGQRLPSMEKAVEKHKAASKEAREKWKEDPPELQLGVASSALENGGNKV